MSSNLSKIEYKGWPGGLNASEDKSLVQANQLQEATNVRILNDGIVCHRPGFAPILEGRVGTAQIYSMWHGHLGNVLVTHYSDKKLVATTASTDVTLKTYANDSKGQFVFFNGTLLHTNGIDAMQQWDLAAATSSDVAGAPVSGILHVHNDRVFAVVGSVVYETAVNSATDWAGGAAWNIGLGSGGNVIGLGSIGSDLFIFKEKSIAKMSGYSQPERVIDQNFIKDIGCGFAHTIRTAVLSDLGTVIIFLGSDKRLYALTPEMVIEIGEPVQNILDSIVASSGASSGLIGSSPDSAISTICKQYLLSFAVTSETYPIKNTCLCLHLNSSYNYNGKTRWGITRYEGGNTFFPHKNSFQCIAESTTKDIIVGTTITKTPTISYTQCALDTAMNYDKLTSLGTRAIIHAVIRTRDEDVENEFREKHWRRAMIAMSTLTATPFYFDIAIYEYTDETTQAKLELQTITPAFANRVLDYWVDLVNSTRKASIKIDFNLGPSSAAYAFAKISSITIFYKKHQVENRK